MLDLKYLNALNTIPGVGPATLRILKKHFGTYEEAWLAGESSLIAAPISAQARQAILWKKPSINPDRELERLVKGQIWMVAETDETYPPFLREIPVAPVILYGRGDMKKLLSPLPVVGVVGTRRPTQYGSAATESIVRDLVSSGVAIASGLATGIDSQSHETALAEKGVTFAVLGSGIDPGSIFPAENIGLARRIADSGGIVLSEYSPGTPAVKEHFPQRNRIISGLSRGVLVVEAREKSGALITARFALEQNREVFAVPGPIFSATSAGPNKLIQEGAKLVHSAEDILTELGIAYTEKHAHIGGVLGEKESAIYGVLDTPVSVDEIKERTGLDTSFIVTTLSMLELKGVIKNLGQDTYQKISNG